MYKMISIKKLIFLPILLLFFAVSLKSQDLGIKWVYVQEGTLDIGSGNSASQVRLNSFYMSATEVTFDQYDAFCEATGKEKPDDKGWGRGNRPVMQVSWYDAVEFCEWLSNETGTKVRLPGSDEWLFAALGGNKSKGYLYCGSDKWQEVSWSQGNSGERTHPVGSKKPNELGLFDLNGNLWEWCLDNPVDENSNKKGLRGDSFDNPPSNPRESPLCLEADSRHYNIGFRIIKIK